VNIGIIGFGIQGRIRLQTIQKWNGPHRVTAICDTVEPSESDLCGAKYIDRYQDIIKDDNIQAIFVCTPNFLTAPVVVAGLNDGKHVFSEKPPGRTLDETRQMAEALERNPRCKLMFAFNHRHHESVMTAKRVVDSGDLGDILWMRGRYGKSVVPEFGGSWRAQRKYAGGGILLDQGIHMLDLFLLFLGDLLEVKAYVSNLFWKLDVEDNVFAIFRNNKGQVASLHSTMTQWRHLFSMEIFLTKGHVILNGLLTSSGTYGEEELSIARNRFYAGPSVSWENEEKTTYGVNTSWENEMRLFFECIEHDIPVPECNIADALKVMELVDRIYSEGSNAT